MDHREILGSEQQIALKPAPPAEPELPENDKNSLNSPVMDFTGLQAQNPQIGAWLTVQGLGIDYPVVQGADNRYYLNHTAEKKINKLGALFLDHRVRGDYSEFHSVIYGHNMKSGKMFGRLSTMKEKKIFNKVTVGTLYTQSVTYRLEFFAVVVGDSRSAFYSYIFPDTATKQRHLDAIKQRAKFYREIGVTTEDRILALSTCSYEYKDARTLVLARLC